MLLGHGVFEPRSRGAVGGSLWQSLAGPKCPRDPGSLHRALGDQWSFLFDRFLFVDFWQWTGLGSVSQVNGIAVACVSRQFNAPHLFERPTPWPNLPQLSNRKVSPQTKFQSEAPQEDGEYVERPYDPENGIYRGHAGRWGGE